MKRAQHVGFYVNSNNNQVSVVQDFGFLNFEKNLSASHTYISKQYPHKKTGAISVSAFVKHLNLYICKLLAKQYLYLDDMDTFCKKIYRYAPNIHYEYTPYNLQQFMNGQNNIKFVYGLFKIEKTKRNDKYLLIINEKTRIHIDEYDLLVLLNNFHSTYKGNMKKYIHDPNCHLLFGGFIQKVPYRDVFYYEYLSGTFLLTNRYGVFCESYKEVEMYNHIIDYIVNNKKQVVFFKPDFYDISPYLNGYLTDGIICLPNKQIYYVEVFGMHTSEYETKKAYKINKIENQLIAWTPLKELLPDLSKFF